MVLDFKKHHGWSEGLTVVMQLGLTMAGCILFCFWVGYRLDKWLGTRGVFITIFLLLGVAGGGVTAYRQIMDMPVSKNDENNHRNNDA